MNSRALHIPDVILLEPTIFADNRGYFFESFNLAVFSDIIRQNVSFVQDNRSYSNQAVLRGLHYQISNAQGKLVSVLHGEVFDVAVDLRKSSPTFGQWVGEVLSADNKRQLWIPPGFAHGFLVLSDVAEFSYKVTNYWSSQAERCIVFDDPMLNISWPNVLDQHGNNIKPILSEKDKHGSSFENAEIFDI